VYFFLCKLDVILDPYRNLRWFVSIGFTLDAPAIDKKIMLPYNLAIAEYLKGREQEE
jgi:hypothetical protein